MIYRVYPRDFNGQLALQTIGTGLCRRLVELKENEHDHHTSDEHAQTRQD